MPQFDSILFDLDGTLWDATSVTADIWQIVMSHHPEIQNKIDLDTVQKYMGHTNEELASILFPDMPFEEGYALIMESCREENRLLRERGGILYADVREVLTGLAERYPLFIISNCQAGYIDAFLAYHGFGHLITDYISSGDMGMAKADNIRYICRKHGLLKPVYVGDTGGDCMAAADAGCPFIFASYGFGTVPAEKCTAVLSSIRDLPLLLR
ncbi:MAG: HAD family hydrolase [Clostridia bacterium]|nr:HAD family hydrolase [Clostridia bacterium]